MNKTQITNLIRYKTGKNIREVAVEWGYSFQTIHKVTRGEVGKSPIYQIISDATGKPLSKLWPTKFKEPKDA